MDLSKLSDDQLRAADLVIQQSKEAGLDPNFALALAYAESGFSQSAVSPEKGAIGVMQLMPGTAKMLGVNPHNLEENVRGGVTYLKQQLDAFGGNKFQAAAAYNAGPARIAKYLETGNQSLIPDETLKYLSSINSLHPLDSPQQSVEPEEESSAAEPPKEKKFGFHPGQDAIAAGVGAGVGAGAGAAYGVGRGIARTAKAISSIPSAIAATNAGPVNAAPGSVAPVASDLPSPLGPNSQPPNGGRGTYNWSKAFGADELEARNARNMGEAWKLKQVADAAKSKIESIAPGEFSPVPERGGLLLPNQVGSGPRGVPRIPVPPAVATAPPAGPGPLSRIAGGALRVLGNPVIGGAMAGAGIAASGAEGLERMRDKDSVGAAMSGLGALGAGLSAFPPTAPVGLPLALGSTGALAILDSIRNKMAEERVNPQGPANPQELEQAAKPSFGRYPGMGRRRQNAALQITSSLMQDLDKQMEAFAS